MKATNTRDKRLKRRECLHWHNVGEGGVHATFRHIPSAYVKTVYHGREHAEATPHDLWEAEKIGKGGSAPVPSENTLLVTWDTPPYKVPPSSLYCFSKIPSWGSNFSNMSLWGTTQVQTISFHTFPGAKLSIVFAKASNCSLSINLSSEWWCVIRGAGYTTHPSHGAAPFLSLKIWNPFSESSLLSVGRSLLLDTHTSDPKLLSRFIYECLLDSMFVQHTCAWCLRRP